MIELIRSANPLAGIPSSDRMTVSHRTDFSGGKIVNIIFENEGLASDVNVAPLDSPNYIEMEGIPLGIGFSFSMEGPRAGALEIYTYGGEEWDGVERPWKVA